MLESAPSVTPLPAQKWDSELAHILADMNGAPINVHQLMANNPTLMNAWWNFRNHSVNGGTLGKRGAELVILRVAVHMQAWYEWGSHVDRSLACGLHIDDINRVLIHSTTHWPAADATLLRAVDELITNHGLSEQTQIQLAQHYTTAQIMDIIAIHGMYVILACMINSWGLTLDASVQERIKGQASEQGFITAATQFQVAVHESA